MLLNLNAFTGEIPRLASDALPPANGQYVKDCDFTHGDLRGILGNSWAFNASQNVRGLYVHPATGNWFTWSSDVDAVSGQVIDDDYSRFYYTIGGVGGGLYVARGDVGGGGASPSSPKLAGVPTPTAAPALLASTTSFPDGVTGYTFAALCSSGTASTPTTLTATQATVTAGEEYTLTLTQTCGTAASVGSTTYAVGEAEDQASGERWPVLSTQSGASLVNGTLFFKPDVIRGEASVRLMNLYNTAGNLVVSGRQFTLQTTGYYTTSGTGPTDPTEASASTLSFEMTVTLDTGDPIKVAVPLSVSTPIPTIGGGKWKVTCTKQSATVFKFFVNTGGVVESRAYIYTYVNQWNEEGSPSAPLIVDATPGIPVRLQLTFTQTTTYQTLSKIRVYRTSTGSTNTEYQFVEEITNPTVGPHTYTDSIETSKLGGVLSSLGHVPPPAGLTGLVALPNGVMAGFVGKELWFSEPYLGYAWKVANSMSFPNAIKGIEPYENSIFVTTTANPWLVNGVSPESMSQSMLPEIQAGVSKNSITAVGNNVAYLSHDGIVLARGLDTALSQSLQLFTRETWRARYGNNLSSARLSAHDGALICTFDNGTEGFILRLDETTGAFTRYSPAVNAAAVWATNDWLYFARGTTVYAHKGDPNTLPWVWWSKDTLLPKPHNFGCCQVRGTGSVTIEFYGDGTLRQTKTITLTDTPQTFRMLAGYKATKWSVKITGTANAILKQLTLADSPKELQGV
jgi:hypothetical protein